MQRAAPHAHDSFHMQWYRKRAYGCAAAGCSVGQHVIVAGAASARRQYMCRSNDASVRIRRRRGTVVGTNERCSYSRWRASGDSWSLLHKRECERSFLHRILFDESISAVACSHGKRMLSFRNGRRAPALWIFRDPCPRFDCLPFFPSPSQSPRARPPTVCQVARLPCCSSTEGA